MKIQRQLRGYWIFLLMITACLAAVLPCGAQLLPAGRVLGTVEDSSGGLTPRAAVTLTNTDTGISASTLANPEGDYLFPNVLPGRYRITVMLRGFRQCAQALTDQAALSTTVDVTLTVGGVMQSVEVTAPAPLLINDSASTGNVIDRRSVTKLPVPAGGNVGQLISLLRVGMVNQGSYSLPAGLPV